MSDDDDIGIAGAIESLRHELTAAIEAGDARQQRMRFRLDESVEVELHAVVTKRGDGKLGWKVVEIGGSYTAENSHRVTLRLKPEWWDGKQYTTDFRIAASVPSVVQHSDGDAPPTGVSSARPPRIDEGVEDG